MTTHAEPALVMGILYEGLLPPPWFVPVEAPACGVVLDVSAERTTDGVARRFVCDRLWDHTDTDTPAERHRQVTDNTEGRILTWPTDMTEVTT